MVKDQPVGHAWGEALSPPVEDKLGSLGNSPPSGAD